jgi:hypothetical protein
MYDAVTPGNIPPTARLVAGYADGRYANLGQMRARFPHATIVSIAVRWTTRAQVLDVETGDATPAEAVLWCTKTMAGTANSLLTVYCNTSTWPAVRAAFRGARVAEPNYWIAHYDGVASIPAGAIAKQYADPGPYDLSAVADHWPGVDPAPHQPPPPAPTGNPTFLEDDVITYLPPIPAGATVDIPVEPAGTATHPQGAVRNGPLFLAFAPQGGTAVVDVTWHGPKGWQTPARHTLTPDGAKYVSDLPTDGSVDKVRVHVTGAPVLGYLTGRQV